MGEGGAIFNIQYSIINIQGGGRNSRTADWVRRFRRLTQIFLGQIKTERFLGRIAPGSRGAVDAEGADPAEAGQGRGREQPESRTTNGHEFLGGRR